MEIINNKIKVRWGSISREMCADISCLDPKNISRKCNTKIIEKLKSINPNVTYVSLKDEYIDFINNFNAFK